MTSTADPTIAAATTAEPPPRRRVLSHIRDAADSTGVPFDYLVAQATQESRLNPDARSRRSSAAGLFQFTSTTWLDMVRKHGAEHGLEAQAALVEKGADGRLTVKDKAARKAILDLRRDPKLSSLMAAEYAKDNAKVLESRLGRTASASDLTLAHFLGAGGALKVLAAMEDTPKRSAAGVMPDAARANPEVFQARSVTGLYNAVQARYAEALKHQPSPLASLTPQPRPQVEPEVVAQQVAATPAPAPAREPLSQFFPVDLPAAEKKV
jgi:hypothetical protein